MALGFKGVNYEVYTFDGSRWFIDTHHRVKARAISRAEELVADGQHHKVKVTAQKDGWAKEDVIFEESPDDLPVKKLKVNPIDRAPVCEDIADYYAHRSRLTIGRLIRQFLDETGLTPLELLFDPSQLVMLERQESFFSSAVNQAASAQAKVSGKKPFEHTEKIFGVVSIVRDWARDTSNDAEGYQELLATKGLPALMTEIKETISPENRHFHLLSAVAAHMAEKGGWNGKLEQLLDLVELGLDAESEALIDELIAEIVDNPQAVVEVIEGQKDNAAAYQAILLLCQGRARVPQNTRSCIEKLNLYFADHESPLAKDILMARVGRGLRGLQPLTKEGKAEDRKVLVTLIRDMVGRAGLLGGAPVSEGATLRAKMTMSTDDFDLSTGQSIEQMMFYLPGRAARMGYLLDIMSTETGEKHGQTVLGHLANVVKGVTSVRDLVSHNASDDEVAETIKELGKRLDQENMPNEIRQGIGESIKRIISKPPPPAKKPAKSSAASFKIDNRTKNMGKIERRTVGNGTILFHEGDDANEAYIVADGMVEIYRKIGNRNMVMRTLGRGEVIGEMALIDSQPRSAAARCVADTELVVISEADLNNRLEWLDENDKVLKRLLEVLVQRLRGYGPTAE